MLSSLLLRDPSKPQPHLRQTVRVSLLLSTDEDDDTPLLLFPELPFWN